MDANKIMRLYFKPYFYMKAKIVKDSVIKKTTGYITGNRKLSKVEKEKIKSFFAPYTKVNTIFHEFYTEKTGVFSERYIPTDIYSNVIDNYYNRRYEAKTVDNKCNYPMLFAGIKQAEMIVARNGDFWYDAHGQMIDLSKAEQILNNESAAFVKKATDSFGGKGVQYICSADGKLFDELREAIKDIHGDLVVQQPLKQHHTLAQINESSVNTIRVLSMLRADGVKIYSCVLRMGIGGSKVDNASSGGITCGIDSDGKLKKRAFKPSGEVFEKHPTSGVTFEGYQIPSFETLKEVVHKAHPMIPHFRLVAWDFAIDEQGEPIMIEANLCLGELDFHQLNNGPVFGEDTVAVLNEVYGKNQKKCNLEKS